jgi:hypothetical protein
MKEYEINGEVFIVPTKFKPISKKKQQWFCDKSSCSNDSEWGCSQCIFADKNELAFKIWIQDEDCVNNFLLGKE